MTDLDSPQRIHDIQRIIGEKASLKHFYAKIYRGYARALALCPGQGIALELGSGGGFAKEVLPDLVTSDIIAYPGTDMVVDATALPFADGSLRFICMTNVFHHIPDAALFLGEAQRCLMPGGRLLITDQHLGLISRPILRHLHHEPCDPVAKQWRFATTGPLSGANGALPWLVFVRDRARLAQLFPQLELCGYRPHTPLGYWLCGGLKRWNLLPRRAIRTADLLDRLLLRVSPELGSFTDIELVKK
jgi:SAM-dependent methyltransferase